MEYELSVIVSQLLFFILDIIVLFNSLRNRADSRADKIFNGFAVAVVLQQGFGMLTQLLGEGALNGVIVLYPVYIGAIIFMTAASYYWIKYLEFTLLEKKKASKLSAVLDLLPIGIITVTGLLSPFTHWLFFIDGSGVYHRGSLFVLQMACPYAYLLFAIVLVIYKRRSFKDKNKIKTLKFFFLFMTPSLLGVAIQMFVVQGGYSAIGISIGFFLSYIEMYIDEINENRRLKSIESLNFQLQKANTELEDKNWELQTQMEKIKLLNKELNTAKVTAEAANNSKTSFLFNMSHEIRTPMNAIMGFRDLLEKNQDNPEKRADYLVKIKDSSNVLLSIINNILEMARIEKGTFELEEEVLVIDSFGDTVYSVFFETMKQKGIDFSVNTDVIHPYVYGDNNKLREVFFNLVSNANKYTEAGGAVSMTVKELPYDREGYALIRTVIADNGTGISKDFLPHLFEEFAREQTTDSKKIQGTGLGMSIVKSLIDMMEGTIEVESEKGRGTVITVTIPLRIAEKPEQEYSSELVKNPDVFKGKRILLAEDNELNAEIAIELLQESGLIVERAEDGSVAVDMIEKAEKGWYALVLMDIQMPKLNGYEATKTIRAMNDTEKAAIPILAMTANAFEEDKRDALNAGMNGHLAKPIKIEDVLNAIAEILNR